MNKFIKYSIFGLGFLIQVIFLSSIVNSIEWHNCCQVSVDENKLNSLYHHYVENYLCYSGEEYNDCLNRAIKEGKTIDFFRNKLIDEPIKECENRTRLSKNRYAGICDSGVLWCDGLSEDVKNGKLIYFEEDSLDKIVNNPLNKKHSTVFRKYSLEYDDLGWSKDPTKYAKNPLGEFTLENSRFNYLTPKISFSKFREIYDSAYSKAKEICINRNISEKIKENGYLLTNKNFIKCLNDVIPLTNYEKGLFLFYTNNVGVGVGIDDYIDSLGICEETLGYQNDIGLVKFPGQDINSCLDSDKDSNGCCKGYHFDKKFNICCSEGFEGFKTSNGNIVCVKSSSENEIYDVDIKLNKNELILNGNDKIIATLTYKMKDKAGNIVPYSNKNIFHGFIVDSNTNQFQFNTKKLSDKTDSNGVLEVEITPKKTSFDNTGLNSLKDVKVYFYSLDEKDSKRKDVYFTLSLGSGIKIKNIDYTPKKIWQSSPVNIKVEVNDPMNEKKLYKFESTTSFKLGTKSSDYILYHSTKDNEVNLIWYAPEISIKTKMKYTQRMVKALAKMGLTLSEDIMTDKLSEKLDKIKVDDLDENFKKINDFYDKFNIVTKTTNQAISGAQIGNDIGSNFNEKKSKSNPKSGYEYAQQAIQMSLWIEGTTGYLGLPYNPFVSVLKTGLTGVDEWYNLVKDMEKVANSKKVTYNIPVTISVEGYTTKTNDTKIIKIPVSGYKLILEND